MCCLLVSGMHLRVVGTKDNSENESIFVGFFFLFSSFLSTAPSLLHPFHNYTFSNSFSPQVEASPSFFFFSLSLLLQGSSSIERQNSSNKKSSYLRLISLFFFFFELRCTRRQLCCNAQLQRVPPQRLFHGPLRRFTHALKVFPGQRALRRLQHRL